MNNALQRTEQMLAAIEYDGEEGQRIFTRVYPDTARAAARAADERAATGNRLSPLDGRVVSVKDLFDVAGEPTTAGSAMLRDAPPATQDAAIVARLRAAGAIIIGKTNMTEFAFSGIGINPHYGTPGNAADITRIPGGSSSGAGVAVARGMSEIAIGTDTGGSVRIPAALNGITGFKPTQARIPRDGAFPLSYTLDTIGPLAANLTDCIRTDAIMSGTPYKPLTARPLHDLRIGIPQGLLLTQMDEQVTAAFEQALALLSEAGAQIIDVDLEEWMTAPFRLQEKGGLSAAEAAHIHQQRVKDNAKDFDPRVLSRIRTGIPVPATHYINLLRTRAQLQASLDVQLAQLDILVLPTVPVVAPTIDSLAADANFTKYNMLMLRNPSVFNFYDLPAASLPVPQEEGQLPVGMMVVGRHAGDAALLSACLGIEQLFHSITA